MRSFCFACSEYSCNSWLGWLAVNVTRTANFYLKPLLASLTALLSTSQVNATEEHAASGLFQLELSLQTVQRCWLLAQAIALVA